MAEMQAKIEEERKALEAKLDMEEEERNKARAELEKREKDLLKAQWVFLYYSFVTSKRFWHRISFQSFLFAWATEWPKPHIPSRLYFNQLMFVI